jgi:glyoxylase-like metal-dependent hydrolase (beta-lactamase superfamily II)
MKRIVSLFSIITLIAGASASRPAQQSRSSLEKSYLQAREILEAGIKAMGGLQELQKIEDVTREMSGVRTDEGQGMQPVGPRQATPPLTNKPRIRSVRDHRGQRTFDQIEDVIFGGQPLKVRSALSGTISYSVSDTSQNIRVQSPPAINNIRTSRFRRYPEALLLTAWNRPEALRSLGEGEFEGRKQRVITFADTDGAEVTMYFDEASQLLTKTEALADDPVLGDINIETVYGDWRPVEKVSLPFRITDRLGGVTQQDLRVTSLALNTHPPDSLFALPEGFAKIDPPPPGPQIKKLSEDVYAILGAYNSLFVVFKDYVLVVEAGGNSRSSAASIAEIKKAVPDKPIRYLVSTHFHFDHLGGVRSYIAEGTTIVTTPSAKSVIERLAGATHSMRPDVLSRKPKAPIIETIDGKRVFDDGTHVVELYRIANPHVGEMIIVYLPREKVLLEADMLDIPEAGLPIAGDDTADLANQIQKLGLKIEIIVPVHGRIGTLEDLLTAVKQRSNTARQ